MGTQPRAVFSYAIYRDDKVIAIIDKGVTSMSVTNDIDNVISYVCTAASISPIEYSFMYRDSEGVRDGFDPILKSFIVLNTESESKALKGMLRHRIWRKAHPVLSCTTDNSCCGGNCHG